MANSVNSSLLVLPGEIRTKIFEFALMTSTASLCVEIDKSGSFTLPVGIQKPAWSLLRTCRQIYSETATMAYSCNALCLKEFARRAHFIGAHLLPAHRDVIRCLRVPPWFYNGERQDYPLERPACSLYGRLRLRNLAVYEECPHHGVAMILAPVILK